MVGQFATDEEKQALSSFIEEAGIRFACTGKARATSDDGWEHDPWLCRFYREGRRFQVTFRMGTGHHGSPPTPESVLSCLADDAAGWTNYPSFEEWASEYGYDTDSRKAYATYQAVTRQTKRLADFLGADLYERLLWDTERD